MGRPLRIEYPGALYHITSRGNERKAIFKDDSDRDRFLEILSDYHDRYGILVHSYVLMDNHYHLVVETPQGNLLKVMHGLNGGYAGYFNRRHGRSWHLFQGRYKGIVVDKDEYLIALSRYVHLNPVRAGIVERPEHYRWSSYPGYVFRGKEVGWVEYSWVLSKFGRQKQGARARYRKFVNEGIGREDILLDDLHGRVMLGGEGFVSRIKALIGGTPVSHEIAERKRIMDAPKAEDILKAVALALGVRENSIRRSGRDNTARKMAVYLIKRYSGLGNREIGEFFGGIHYSAVSKICARLQEDMGKDRKLAKSVKELMSHVKT